ncbi:MAG TPA: DNA translocase FtsK 4TM domain-containing protein [Opitutaceae bacterium]|nr:DNA translocase FtsK 4TM domain-containing protein [Opitutaceae bacterium]
MAKSQTSNPKNVPSFEGPRYRPNWLAACVCFGLGVWIAVTLLNYDPSQSHQYQIGGQSAWDGGKWVIHNKAVPAPNLGGQGGAEFAWWSLHLVGVSTGWIPLFLLWYAWVAIRNARRLVVTRFLAMVVCIATFSGLCSMFEQLFGRARATEIFTNGYGGTLGQLLYRDLLQDNVGPVGGGLLLGTIYAVTLAFIFMRDIAAAAERLLASLQNWRVNRKQRAAARAELKQQEKEEREKSRAAKAATVAAPPPGARKALTIPKTKEEIAREAAGAKIVDSVVPASNKPMFTSPPFPVAAAEPAPAAGRTTPPTLGKLNIVKPEEPKKAKAAPAARSDENYQFPPLSLLHEQAKVSASASEEEHRHNAENLLRILAEFGVEVTIGEIHVGPVITRYEVIPAAGVRVEKISGLDKNIALGMRAQSVRIMAPIPGKAAVGVEVPNQNRAEVGLRDIIESEDWEGAKAELPIALGKDVSGRPLVSDLAKMPHLLIAGATGSGKSVCINAIIASILYKASPRDVRFLMVDPKIVELKIFNDLPHMLIPVVTEAKKVPAALKWLLREMEQRYQIFAKAGVRNIASFNSRKRPPKEAAPAPTPEAQGTLEGVAAGAEIEVPDHLHYIIVIIDELADLMMVAPAEIETSVARLAQLARATGIHIVIATQRPSVNVITGIIKANLPSRIAFQVASQVDSRTIIDIKGAETLIGRGDMLFSPPGSSKLVRAQGALVSDEEIHGVVEFLKRNGPPVFAQDVQAHIDREASEDEEDGEGEADTEGEMGDDEELFKQALEVLRATRRASTSMLQRRLRIGYNRAARIMELMEEKGIVGPENGALPREILADLDKL